MKPKENGDKKENDKKEVKENIESKENEKTEKKNIKNKNDENNLNINFINSFNFKNTVPQESSSFSIPREITNINENNPEFMSNALDYQDDSEGENSSSNANQNNEGISTTVENSKS